MKLNAGIITAKIQDSRKFYVDTLGFEVKFENDFYLLLETPDKGSAVSFLLPGHESQQPLFHESFTGKGVYFTIEVEDVDSLYNALRQKAVNIQIPLRDEPWGDRHFAISDPNGVAIDFVTYSQPDED